MRRDRPTAGLSGASVETALSAQQPFFGRHSPAELSDADVVRDDSDNTDRGIDQCFGHCLGVGEDEEEFGLGCGFAADMGAT